MMMTTVELGTHVRAKKDFEVRWLVGGIGKKIADVKAGMEGIVMGFDDDKPIINVVDYAFPVSLEPFDEFWEITDPETAA